MAPSAISFFSFMHKNLLITRSPKFGTSNSIIFNIHTKFEIYEFLTFWDYFPLLSMRIWEKFNPCCIFILSKTFLVIFEHMPFIITWKERVANTEGLFITKVGNAEASQTNGHTYRHFLITFWIIYWKNLTLSTSTLDFYPRFVYA